MFRRDLPGTGVLPSPVPTPSPSTPTSARSVSVQSDMLPTLDEIEKRFKDAEETRHKVFEQSRRQQQICFLEAITVRDNDADKRDREFILLLTQVRQTYLTNRADRLKTFDASEAKRDALYHFQESARQAAFEMAQTHRDRVVQRTQDQQKKLADRVASQRDALFSQGHVKRQQLYDQLTKDFSDRFNALLGAEDAEFLNAQTERDEWVNSLAQQRGGSNVNTGKYTSNAGATSLSWGPTKTPSTLAPTYTLVVNSMPSKALPQATLTFPTLPLPSPPSISVNSTVLVPPYSPSTPPPLGTVPAHAGAGSGRQQSLDTLIKDFVAQYNDIFETQEKHRGDVFSTDLKTYDAGFEQEAEDTKNAVSSRQGVFQKTSDTLYSMFTEDQERYLRVFKGKTFLQDGRESHRKSHFSIVQQTFLLCFDQDQAFISKDFMLADQAEWEYWKVVQSGICDVQAIFYDSLKSLLQKHSQVFEAALEEYERVLGIPLLQSPLVHSASDYLCSHNVCYDSECMPSVCELSSRSEVLSAPMQPEKLFSAKTLFCPSIFTSKLPIPDRRLQSSDTLKSALLQMLQEHSVAFIKAQEKRQKAFMESLQKKQDIISIQNLQEEIQFKKLQKTFQLSGESRELEHYGVFNKEEKQRDEVFLKSEAAREGVFLGLVQQNQDIFSSHLAKVEKAFFDHLEGLVKKAYDCEGRRMKDTMTWEAGKWQEVQQGIEAWKKKFTEAEEARKRRFSELLRMVK